MIAVNYQSNLVWHVVEELVRRQLSVLTDAALSQTHLCDLPCMSCIRTQICIHAYIRVYECTSCE